MTLLPENIPLYGNAVRAAMNDLRNGRIDITPRLDEYNARCICCGKLGIIPGQMKTSKEFTDDVRGAFELTDTIDQIERWLDSMVAYA